jgi:hypothetical protein
VPLEGAADIVLRQKWRYKICNADPFMVTVQERGCRAYRVSGNKKGPPTFLSAVDSDGVHQAFLEVSVKSLSSYRIAFYSVSDSNVATGKIIHTTHKRRSEDLKQLVQGVNEILRPQANVIFEMIEHLVIDAKGRPQMTSIQSVTIAKDLGPAVKAISSNTSPALSIRQWLFTSSLYGRSKVKSMVMLPTPGPWGDSVYSKTAFHTGRKLRCWLMKRCTTCYSPLGGRLIIITPKGLVT